MVYVEFVFPPDSCEVIAQVEMGAVPRVADSVYIGGIDYRVYNVEWVHIEDTGQCNPLVNLLKDEIEEHTKKREK